MKQQVYEAEFRLRDFFSNATVSRTAEVYGTTLTLPDERWFGSLETVQSYVDAVRDIVASRYPSKDCTVCEGRKSLRRKAYWDWNRIVLPQREVTRWAWREIVVLHEIAHHLTPGASHNEEFCGAYVHLLNTIMGPEAGWLMTVLLADNGITIKEEEYA